MNIFDVETGKSYACKFKVETMLDTLGRPAPNLSDVPLKGKGLYEGFGLIAVRDTEQELCKIHDIASKKEFIVSFDDMWDIDEAEYVDE